jgi:acetyltransferase-like isoleucine patch superfamily enzyme
MSNFDPEVSWEIREQILKYQATFCMSDSERAAFLGLPEGCRIRENAKILSQHRLEIGVNCWIGEGAVLDASGGLRIGSNTSIGLGVYVWTHDSHKLNILGKNTPETSSLIKRQSTSIGNNCFVGGPSVIMPGVNVGNGCVIAPMSVVFKDLPGDTVYAPYRDTRNLVRKVASLERRLSEMESKFSDSRGNA